MSKNRPGNKPDKQPDLLGQAASPPMGETDSPSGPLEIVWSAEAFTGSPDPIPHVIEPGTSEPQHPTPPRIVHAMESDFLDNAVISGETKSTDRQYHQAAEADVSGARLIDIYAPEAAKPPQSLPAAQLSEQTKDKAASPVDAAGTATVSSEATERTGTDDETWKKPKGMVFFETVRSGTTPPQGVVYSSLQRTPPRLRLSPDEPAGQSGGISESSNSPSSPTGPASSGTHFDHNIAAESKPADDASPVLPPALPESSQPVPAPAANPFLAPPTSSEEFASQAAMQAFYQIPAHDDDPGVDESDDAQPTGTDDDLVYVSAPAKPRSTFYMLFNLACWCLLAGFLLISVIAIIYGRYAWKRLYSPQPGDTKTVTLVVQQGDTLNTIAAKLHKEGLLGGFMGLDDRFLLRYLGHVNENANKIKPGAYRLESSQSLNDVYLRLIKGSQDFKITIPEGKTGREVAAEVKRRYKDFNDARFLELLNDKAFIATLKMDVPSLEGYLYPSTYFFGPGMKEEELVQQMVGLFQKRVEDSLKNVDKQDTFTFHEHLVMASLIEKEARMDEDRPLIASVIFNRLEKGMPLQIDATINYALNDWRRLSYADLKIDSPYNTYKNKGLPPGPIANPRMQSLLATFTAPKTDYLYYVYQGNGRHAFSASYEEFLKNKRLYLKDQAEAAGSEETTATGGQNEQKPANDVSEKVPARSGTPPARRTRRQ